MLFQGDDPIDFVAAFLCLLGREIDCFSFSFGIPDQINVNNATAENSKWRSTFLS